MANLINIAIILIASGLFFWLNYSTFNPEVELKGKNVLITGASSGIGEELAYQYAKYQANILITARRQPLLNKVAEKCKQLGANKVEIVVADMSTVSGRDRLLQETEKHFGQNLDYLILNHAIFPMRFWTGGADNMTFLQQTLNTNFVSYVDLASRSIPLLQKNKGHIAILSAPFAKCGFPKLTLHSAAKAALHGFFSPWRQELKFRNIPVSITLCVLGLIDTERAMDEAKHLDTIISPQTMAASASSSAEAIVESVALKQYEMYFPRHISLFTIVHSLFGGYVEDILGTQILGTK